MSGPRSDAAPAPVDGPAGADAAAPSGPAGRIHDIGYRHYEGPRLGRAHVLRSLYIHNLRGVYGVGRPIKSKVFPFLLSLFMLVPAAGSIAVVTVTRNATFLIPYSTYAVTLQIIVTIFLAAQAPVIAARELRSHVIPLYFSRPVNFLDFVLAKYGALATAVLLLLAAPITLLYVGALVTKVPHPLNQTGDFLLGLAGCALFAVVLAGLALVIAAFAPRRGFGVAAIMAVYLLSSGIVVIVQGIAIQQGRDDVAGWAALFSPFSLVNTVQMTLLGGHRADRFSALGTAAGLLALGLCLVVVTGSLALLYTRFRKAGR